jgi:hypothetical protein
MKIRARSSLLCRCKGSLYDPINPWALARRASVFSATWFVFIAPRFDYDYIKINAIHSVVVVLQSDAVKRKLSVGK